VGRPKSGARQPVEIAQPLGRLVQDRHRVAGEGLAIARAGELEPVFQVLRRVVRPGRFAARRAGAPAHLARVVADAPTEESDPMWWD
jgi:hypothetical protein